MELKRQQEDMKQSLILAVRAEMEKINSSIVTENEKLRAENTELRNQLLSRPAPILKVYEPNLNPQHSYQARAPQQRQAAAPATGAKRDIPEPAQEKLPRTR